MANYGHTTDWQTKRKIKSSVESERDISIGDNIQLNFDGRLGGKGKVISIFYRRGRTCVQFEFEGFKPFTVIENIMKINLDNV